MSLSSRIHREGGELKLCEELIAHFRVFSA